LSKILLGPGGPLEKAILIIAVLGAVSGPAPAPFGTAVLGPLEPILFQFMKGTDLGLTVDHPIVIGAWGTVLAIADAFFFLLIVLGAIQIMLSQSTGTLTLPLSQFVPKILVTALMMHLSYFFGHLLLSFNNDLCGAVNVELDALFHIATDGQKITTIQSFLLYAAVTIILNFSILRLLIQTFERIVLWDLLFVLSSLAFLFSFLPHTSSVFSYWGRLFLVVTFTQFVQFLALSLGLALLAGAGLNGLAGELLAIAMLLLVAKIPDLLGRFPSMAIQGSQGIGRFISTIIVGARLLA